MPASPAPAIAKTHAKQMTQDELATRIAEYMAAQFLVLDIHPDHRNIIYIEGMNLSLIHI